MKVPFVDLKAQHDSIRKELDEAISRVIESNAFILGEPVQRFEEEFASYCNSKHAAGVSSGTAALHLALLAKGIGKGDEVLTVANTFIATAEAVSHCNAVPRFADISTESYNMDPERLEKAITKKTKAILPVHLYGQPADMKHIMEIAEKHGLQVIEDCAQAHGAEYRGRKVPVSGTGCFSFYPAKNLGALGEGGAVVSDDSSLIEKVRLLRAHGEKPKNVHSRIGFNYRMEGLQGAVLRAKLKHLDSWIEARRANAKRYGKEIGEGVTKPSEMGYAKHVYHLYVIRVKERKRFREEMSKKGIATGVHYSTPIHLQPAYSSLGLKRGALPETEKAMQEIVSLPMYPELSEEQAGLVAGSVNRLCPS